MNRRQARAWWAAGICAAAVALSLALAGAAGGQPSRSERSAVDEDVIGRVNSKLDDVLENQEQMLARFDEVMEELRIIKIRATRRN